MKIEYKKGKLIIPIEKGDTMLVGRFKYKAVKVKTIELSKLGVANALKKNTRQKKFGMPKVTPQNTSPSLTDFSSFVNFIK